MSIKKKAKHLVIFWLNNNYLTNFFNPFFQPKRRQKNKENKQQKTRTNKNKKEQKKPKVLTFDFIIFYFMHVDVNFYTHLLNHLYL